MATLHTMLMLFIQGPTVGESWHRCLRTQDSSNRFWITSFTFRISNSSCKSVFIKNIDCVGFVGISLSELWVKFFLNDYFLVYILYRCVCVLACCTQIPES